MCVLMYVALSERPALVGISASMGTSGVHLRQRTRGCVVSDDSNLVEQCVVIYY